MAAMRDFVRERCGEEGFQQWLASLTPEARKTYGGQIMSGSWYPLDEMIHKPLAKYCDLFDGGNSKGAREVGYFTAEHALKGVFDVFLKGGSPEDLIGRGGVILAAHYKPPPTAQIESSKGHGVLRFTEFPEITPHIEHYLAGWIECALNMLGCKDIKVKITRSMAKGDTCSEWDATWKQ